MSQEMTRRMGPTEPFVIVCDPEAFFAWMLDLLWVRFTWKDYRQAASQMHDSSTTSSSALSATRSARRLPSYSATMASSTCAHIRWP